MEIDLNPDAVKTLFETALRTRMEVQDGTLRAKLYGAAIVGPTVIEIQELIDSLKRAEHDGEATIYTSRDIEVLVREETSFLGSNFTRRGHSPLQLHDPDTGMRYTLGPPSDRFILYLLDRVSDLNLSETLFWRRELLRHGGVRTGTRNSDAKTYRVIDALRDALPRLRTIQIHSEQDLSLKALMQAADSFAFQVAYNLDTAFVAVRSLEEVARRTRLRRIRRVRAEELDPPRRSYEPDLVHHYLLAVSTDSVPLEYLSYYHIAEHFFESVFEDDLIARLRNALTQPGFSFRRRQDLRALVTLMRSRLKFQREDVTFSEQEALRLVFEKYVDLGALRDQLQGIQSNLPEYYASNQVSFSGGDVVDLAGDESRGVFEALSRRVYKTRNSVVHSKESGRPRYQPFRHDRELAQELPLMRILAEEVVVNSGGVVG